MRGALLYRVAGRISLHTREQESFLPLESHLSLFFGDKKHGTRGSSHTTSVSSVFQLPSPCTLGALAGFGAPPPKVFGTSGRRFTFSFRINANIETLFIFYPHKSLQMATQPHTRHSGGRRTQLAGRVWTISV